VVVSTCRYLPTCTWVSHYLCLSLATESVGPKQSGNASRRVAASPMVFKLNRRTNSEGCSLSTVGLPMKVGHSVVSDIARLFLLSGRGFRVISGGDVGGVRKVLTEVVK